MTDHDDYRQQAAAHFGTPQHTGGTTPPQPAAQSGGARTPRLFRPADGPAPSTAADSTATQHGTPATQSGPGTPPASGQRFGAGTTYTGRGPDQAGPPSPPPAAMPTPPPYVPPPNPSVPAPPPAPPGPTSWQPPPQHQAPQPTFDYPSGPSQLSTVWQRFNNSVDRLLARGANNELLRQPWFDSMRNQNAELFVYLSYGIAVVISLLLGVGTASAAVMILLGALWAGLSYLYIALNTRLARQFLEFGICLVAVIVSAITALASVATLSGGYPAAIAEGLFGLLFSVATGLFFGAVGLRVHQAAPLPPPPAPQLPFASPAGPPPVAPQANWPGRQPVSPWTPQPGSPQFSYPAAGGTAIAAAILSFIGVAWFGLGAAGAALMISGTGQLLGTYRQLGVNLGWPFYGALALSVVQIIIPILLLIGGIQLLSRRLAGRRTITWGCVLVLVSTAFWTLALVGVTEWLNAWTAGLGAHRGIGTASILGNSGFLWAAIPGGYAVVTMMCALSPSTRAWCRPPGAYGAPWYGPPAGP